MNIGWCSCAGFLICLLISCTSTSANEATASVWSFNSQRLIWGWLYNFLSLGSRLRRPEALVKRDRFILGISCYHHHRCHHHCLSSSPLIFVTPHCDNQHCKNNLRNDKIENVTEKVAISQVVVRVWSISGANKLLSQPPSLLLHMCSPPTH